MMNINPLMVVVLANVLRIQLPKYHDNDDHVKHIRQLTIVCMTNGEDTNNHKLKYFPNSLKGKTNGFPGMNQLIQRQHGVKYYRLSSIDLMRFIVKGKQLQL